MRSFLLLWAGDAAHEIFENLPGAQEAEDCKATLKLLTRPFLARKNRTFEIYTFRQAQQLDGESVAQLYTRLRQLASTCEFTDHEGEIQSQIIQRCTSKKLRETALRDDSITPEKLLEHARAFENSAKQFFQMEKNLTTPEQNLAALNITEDEASSRQGSRNKLYSYNNNRRDSRRLKPRDNRQAISQQNNTECRQIDNPSAAKCYNFPIF